MKYTLLLFLPHIKFWLVIILEIFTLRSYHIWTFYNTFTVPQAHKYKQNKTGTTDTDYEHKNVKKQELSSES